MIDGPNKYSYDHWETVKGYKEGLYGKNSEDEMDEICQKQR